jgi:hypothetical protein
VCKRDRKNVSNAKKLAYKPSKLDEQVIYMIFFFRDPWFESRPVHRFHYFQTDDKTLTIPPHPLFSITVTVKSLSSEVDTAS